MSHLVDANIAIDYLRERAEAITFIEGLREEPRLSVASVMELYAGARSAKEERRIERLISNSKTLLVTLAIARTAGQFVKHYGPSHGLDEIDALIAATAEHHGLPLATLNVKHFPMFPKLRSAY